MGWAHGRRREGWKEELGPWEYIYYIILEYLLLLLFILVANSFSGFLFEGFEGCEGGVREKPKMSRKGTDGCWGSGLSLLLSPLCVLFTCQSSLLMLFWSVCVVCIYTLIPLWSSLLIFGLGIVWAWYLHVSSDRQGNGSLCLSHKPSVRCASAFWLVLFVPRTYLLHPYICRQGQWHRKPSSDGRGTRGDPEMRDSILLSCLAGPNAHVTSSSSSSSSSSTWVRRDR